MSGYVGFKSFPDPLVNRFIQQGFCFNIFCVGEIGIGKSMLINTLFNTNFEDHESSHFTHMLDLTLRHTDSKKVVFN